MTMNKLIPMVAVGLVASGCAFNPEAMPVGQKDSMVYVDEGAPKSLDNKEIRSKVAVVTSVGEHKDYKSVADALDSSLSAKLSGFSFFEVVDRSSAAAIIQNAVATGEEMSEVDTTGVEADFLVIARIASLNIASSGAMTTPDVVFDFKWISTATKRVIMTESIKPDVRTASSQAEVVSVLGRAAEVAARTFCAKIATKYAPPARVLQTRGNGAAARISIGKNYGVCEGTRVCFFEIVDNSDVGGEKRDMNDIAVGEVKSVENKTAWVKVEDAEKVNVRKGVYVRVLETKRGFMDSLSEKTGFGN